MNIYVITRTDDGYYDQAHEFVVIAPDEAAARRLCVGDCGFECKARNADDHEAKCFWVTSPHVVVECVGVAHAGAQARMLVRHFLYG